VRDYTYFDQYYSELVEDIYAQPSDEGHLKASNAVIIRWLLSLGIETVLDVGCGDASSEVVFEENGIEYCGVALGQDGKSDNPKVQEHDFTFLPYSSFDLIYARHVLEHSPFPIITLMEWYRVSNKYLCVVLPNPEHYTYVGKNHYSVMTSNHAAWLLRRAGWKIRRVKITDREFQFLCSKESRLGYEGWAEAPISNILYEFERDLVTFKGEMDVDAYFRARADEIKQHEQWVAKMKNRGKL